MIALRAVTGLDETGEVRRVHRDPHVAVHCFGNAGGCSSLQDVQLLFGTPWLLLAGWLFYLGVRSGTAGIARHPER